MNGKELLKLLHTLNLQHNVIFTYWCSFPTTYRFIYYL